VQLQGGTVEQRTHRPSLHLDLSQTSTPPGKKILLLQLHRLLLQLALVQGEEQRRRQHPPRSNAPNQYEGGVFLRALKGAFNGAQGGWKIYLGCACDVFMQGKTNEGVQELSDSGILFLVPVRFWPTSVGLGLLIYPRKGCVFPIAKARPGLEDSTLGKMLKRMERMGLWAGVSERRDEERQEVRKRG
jgi:hypothetical protein